MRAADAVALFCYLAKMDRPLGGDARWVGHTLVFAGGVGEKTWRVCDDHGFLGVERNEKRDVKNASLISPVRSRAGVRIIHTNEQLMIAKLVSRVPKLHDILKT